MLHSHREQAVEAVRRRVGDATDAEDCVQDAVVRLVERGNLDPDRLRSLLTRTALHIAIDRRRARRREEAMAARLGGDAALETTSPEQVVADRAEVERVMAAVAELPRREREVLLMRLSGLSVTETAERLGVTYKSIEGAYTRARARVRLILGSALGWLAVRLRRTPHQQAEAFAASIAVLLFAGPLWHQGADASGKAGGRTVPIAASRSVAAPQPRVGTPSSGPQVRSVLVGVPHGASRSAGGSGDGHKPPPHTVIDTGPITVPNPTGNNQPPLFSGPGPAITWDGTLDPVGGIERCLDQGGPRIALYNGGC